MAEEYNYNRVMGATKWWDSSTTTTSSSLSSSSAIFSDNQSLRMMGLGLGQDHNMMTGAGFRPMSMYSDEPSPVKGFSLDQFSHTSSVDSCSHGGLASPTLLTPIESGPTIFQAFMDPPVQSGFGYNQAAGYGNSDGLMGSSPDCNWTTLTTSSNKIHHEAPHQFLKGSNQNHFINNFNSHGGSFWNTVASEPRPASFFPVVPPLAMPTFHDKNHHKNNMTAVKNMSTGVGRKSTSGSNRTSTTATASTTSTGGGSAKRSRNEASSTMPPFKVRKEKMGDRITALQQLVSPFGKTDTASVLSEAIEYIKFLHEQVNVLSTPYLKSGASSQLQHQSRHEMLKDPEAPRKDLRSRGLCLVPISSTFPVAHETTVDFWTPAFGSTTFR